MRLFLDANILVSVVNKEYPLFSLSSRILSLTDHPNFDVYTSPLCLGITFYFAEKKSGTKQALSKMKILCSKLKIAAMDENVVNKTMANPKINDFEDGLEYYAALGVECDMIITEDVGDFHFSDLDILTCERFIKEKVND